MKTVYIFLPNSTKGESGEKAYLEVHIVLEVLKLGPRFLPLPPEEEETEAEEEDEDKEDPPELHAGLLFADVDDGGGVAGVAGDVDGHGVGHLDVELRVALGAVDTEVVLAICGEAHIVVVHARLPVRHRHSEARLPRRILTTWVPPRCHLRHRTIASSVRVRDADDRLSLQTRHVKRNVKRLAIHRPRPRSGNVIRHPRLPLRNREFVPGSIRKGDGDRLELVHHNTVVRCVCGYGGGELDGVGGLGLRGDAWNGHRVANAGQLWG